MTSLQVFPEQRYFSDGDGSPVFWLGDTLWELFRVFDQREALRILTVRKAQGFNVILIMLTGVDTSNFSDAETAPFVDLNGELPWIDFDPQKPNEKYFERIDSMIRLGETTDQVLVVGVYHQWHVDILPTGKARAWGKWLGERYRDVSNLVWSMYPKATEAFTPVCRELAAGLSEGDGGSHLISVHPDPSVASSSFIHDERWLSFNMIQTCIDYDRIPETVAGDFVREPIKPVVMAEGGYEGLEFGKLQTAHDIRKQAYWTQLSGGYFVYGHNESWLTPRKTENWLHAPGAEGMKTFRNVITSLPTWWEMIPDNSVIVDGRGEGFLQNVAARSGAGDWIAVYFSTDTRITLNLNSLEGAAAHEIWINPATGERERGRTVSTDTLLTASTPTSWEDAFLLLTVE